MFFNNSSIDEQAAPTNTPASADLAANSVVSIINYGPGDLEVNFDKDTTSKGAFTIRSGNTFECYRGCSKLYWNAKADTTFTAVGV